MPRSLPSKPKADAKIDKPEDHEWKKWYQGLSEKEHESYLAKLGLDNDDIKEWEGHSVLKSMEAEETETDAAPKPRKTRK